MTSSQTAIRFLLFAGLFALSACGGGGGSSSESPLASTLGGTAAFGAAFSGGSVQVIDRSGSTACTNAPVTTDSRGTYTCTLSTASQAPMVVVVTDPTGLVSPLVSLVASKPAAGARASVNVTPLTTAIAAQVDNTAAADQSKDAFALFKQPAALANLDLGQLSAVTRNLVTQLASVLISVGVDPATFDPFTSPIEAGSGTGTDAVLDQVRVSFVNGGVELSNALNPTAPSVPMAGTDTSAVVALSASVAVAGGFFISELDFAQTEMQRCFSVPAATRAPNADATLWILTDVDPACQNAIAGIEGAPNVGVNFLQNGYGPDAYFYRSFTSASMDGARFNRPELMRFFPSDEGRHTALLNLKYTDAQGYPGGYILTAMKFPGSRPDGQSQWWLVGNQRQLDANITTEVRRRDQTVTDFDTYQNAGSGRYDTGLRIGVRRGSLTTPNNPNAGIWYIRVRGPALPTAGMVLADVPVVSTSELMGFLNAEGVIPSGPQQLASAGAPITLRLQRTAGLQGSVATTLRPNPGVSNESTLELGHAHPTMYGTTPSSSWLLDVSGVVPWANYTFEAFDGSSSTVPVRTWTAPLIAPLVPAVRASLLPWHGPGTSTTQFLTLGAPAVSTVTVDWVQNPLAERVQSVGAESYLNSSNQPGASTSDEVFPVTYVTVPRGATSAVVTAAGGAQWQSLIAPTTTTRIVTLNYQMLDSSRKQEQRFFN